MRLSSNKRRKQRGAAATEMALMMIIFVPLLLFVAYASDAVFHQLEVQETVISTVWDFSTARFGFRCGGKANGACTKLSEKANKAGDIIAGPNMYASESIAGFNRAQYADHDSSFSNEKRVNEGTWMDEEHHTQAFGQVSWCDGAECRNKSAYSNMTSGQQVFCQINRDSYDSAGKFSMEMLGGTSEIYKTAEGGVVECWAKGWLMNYVIGDTFIGDFPGVEKVKLFNKKRHVGHVHDEHTTGGSNASADVLMRSRAGMLVDSWAALDHFEKDGLGGNMNKHRNIELAKTDSLFFKRAEKVFENTIWYIVAVGGVSGYAGKAAQKKLGAITAIPWMGPTLVPGMPEFLLPPNPLGLWMTVKSHDGNKHKDRLTDYEDKPTMDVFGKKLMTTPIYDDFKTAWQNRGNNYLGARDAEKR